MIKRKARKELGATKAGDLIFTFPSVSENTHLMINADNSVTGLSTTALGAEVLGSTMSDIIPAIGGVYDLGATGFEWYDGFFSNSVNIDGGVIQGAAGAIAVNDVLIVDNVLSQLSTPLYGHREIISEGGFTIASMDPAYLRLTQLPTPVQPDPISVDGSYMTYYNLRYYNNIGGSGNAMFTWEEAYGPDVSSFFVPGDIYTITYFTGSQTFTDNYEFVSTTNNMGVREVFFVSPNPGDLSSYYLYQAPNAIVITPPTVDDYTTVLDSYGSEGMIRFHPVTKEFEGHDGTAWGPLGVTPTVFVCGLNIGTCLTGGNGLFSSSTCHNIFLGQCAGYCHTYGSSNNFFGSYAGYCNDGASRNNFFGESAGYHNKGSDNNFFGSYAGTCNNYGSGNNFFGCEAGRFNTDGSHNNFFGQGAGRCNTTGCYNNFFGRYAGRENITGSSNNFFGYGAGFENDSGCWNNFFGACAGRNNTTGCENNFFGRSAGFYNTAGIHNNFFGSGAGGYNTTGSYNIFLGLLAGCANTTGCNNIFLGFCSGVGSTGFNSITTQCHRIIMGNCLHTCAQIQVAWTVPSDVRDKCIFGTVPHGRGFLENITPIEYAFKNRETDEITDPPGKRRYGFSAQEVLELEGNNPVIVGDENPEKLNLTTDYIIPILVNGFKELNAEVKQLRAEIELLKKST